MKKTLIALCCCLTLVLLTFSSCKKQDIAVHSSCQIIFNDTVTRTADSIHYDMYNGTTPRIQAFIGSVAVITIWPSSFTTHTQTLGKQYLYWIVQNPAVYTIANADGSLTITNSAGSLSGTCSGTGNVWSNGTTSTPPASTISATFSNVKQLGL